MCPSNLLTSWLSISSISALFWRVRRGQKGDRILPPVHGNAAAVVGSSYS